MISTFNPIKVRSRNNDFWFQDIPENIQIPGEDTLDSKVPVVITEPKLPKQIEKVSFGRDDFLSGYEDSDKRAILRDAIQSTGDMMGRIKEHQSTVKSKRTHIVRNEIEWHRKFSLSIACLILFFVGAPLGAIIRKGGLGWPLILCILIFIAYYVISTIGEKSARQLALTPLQGMWISTAILFPFGLFLTLKASTDSPIFVMENYKRYFKKLFGRK